MSEVAQKLKVKVRCTATITYDMTITSDYWPEAKTKEEMIKLQQDYFNEEDISAVMDDGIIGHVTITEIK